MPIQGILGKKIGMTQLFDEKGQVTPVTVLEVGPCPVLQIRTSETDGYSAVQIGFDEKRPKNSTKQMLGHFQKAGVDKPRRVVREFAFDGEIDLEPGQEVKADLFEAGEQIKVTGISKGRGFAGTIKRHGFHRGPMTHGSRNVRKPGSIGCATSPAKTIKGRKMPGHFGAKRVTVQGVEVVRVDAEKNLVLVKGGVPGPSGGYVMLRKGY